MGTERGSYPTYPTYPTCATYPALLLILYSPIFRVSVLRCIPRAPAVFVRLPEHRPRTRAMNRFSNSWTASSNRTPRSTISSTSFSSLSLITGHHSSSRPVRRRNASTYFSRVFSTTSSGSDGTGGCLFQRMCSR